MLGSHALEDKSKMRKLLFIVSVLLSDTLLLCETKMRSSLLRSFFVLARDGRDIKGSCE
jgi:hypothetical protein